jgi:hypothetical protein
VVVGVREQGMYAFGKGDWFSFPGDARSSPDNSQDIPL